MPELHDYVNTNVMIDPEHDDLPRERTLEIKGQVIENRVQKTNSAKIQAEICALRECIQERHDGGTNGCQRGGRVTKG